MTVPEYHRPVLVNETITLLDPRPGGVFLDATLGGGGHGAELLERTGPDGVLIGVDRDPESIEFARERLSEYGDRARLTEGNFGDVGSILASQGIDQIDGALFDLGVSSHQLDSPRGFSFQRDEPLDMRMAAKGDTLGASDIVNTYTEAGLADLIHEYGEERYARRVARAIVQRRGSHPIETTGELVDVIVSVIGREYRGQDIHPATRTFQAIRIEVNREFEAIETGIPAAIDALRVGGRICVISFHSGEDRIAKTIFRRYSGKCECPPRLPICVCGARQTLRVLTRKPVMAGEDEIRDNPRSRSAKLRCAERIAE